MNKLFNLIGLLLLLGAAVGVAVTFLGITEAGLAITALSFLFLFLIERFT